MHLAKYPRSALLASILALSVTGCAGYSQQTAEVMAANRSGNIDQALKILESKNTSADKDLLYHLEKGELLREKSSFDDSSGSWLLADEKVRAWEDDARTDPSKLLGDLGSVLLNDTTRRYDGRDYEKVFLNVRLAQNHIAVGNWENARTEIKKMHEREAIITEFRSKELDKARDEARKNGVRTTSFRELNGYPIETLDDPAVRNLTNSYESAFANYLAGFVYETLGEVSLAAPGYRKAAEMRPNTPLIDDALSNLDSRIANRGKSDQVDTLFIIESGTAPTIQSVTLPIILPIPKKHGVELIATPISWPVIRPDLSVFIPNKVTIDNQDLPVVMLTDVNVMARRSLSDEMPGIITRSAVRAITRGISQAAIDASTDNAKGNAKLAGSIISLITKITAVVTEVADERIWRTLPGNYSVSRASLPSGVHKVVLVTPSGPQVADIQLAGPYAVVTLRTLNDNLYVAQSPAIPQPAVVITSTTETPASVVVDKATDKKKGVKAKKTQAEASKAKKQEKQPVDTSPKVEKNVAPNDKISADSTENRQTTDQQQPSVAAEQKK